MGDTGPGALRPYPDTLFRVADPSTFKTYHQKHRGRYQSLCEFASNPSTRCSLGKLW
jgi:hypothetical protein